MYSCLYEGMAVVTLLKFSTYETENDTFTYVSQEHQSYTFNCV